MFTGVTDPLDLIRRAVGYIDQILKSAKPAGMPMGYPTKFEPVIKANVAKQIALTMQPASWPEPTT